MGKSPENCLAQTMARPGQKKRPPHWTSSRAALPMAVRDVVANPSPRSLKGTPEFERSSNARKKVEMRFAHLKVQHGFGRMRLRGLTGARDEFHLAAIVQNLKTTALRLLGPPTDGVCASIA